MCKIFIVIALSIATTVFLVAPSHAVCWLHNRPVNCRAAQAALQHMPANYNNHMSVIKLRRYQSFHAR